MCECNICRVAGKFSQGPGVEISRFSKDWGPWLSFGMCEKEYKAMDRAYEVWKAALLKKVGMQEQLHDENTLQAQFVSHTDEGKALRMRNSAVENRAKKRALS